MTLDASDLQQFHGGETRYRHWMTRFVVYTEGVKYLAELGEAYWLLDAIASAFPTRRFLEAQATDPRIRSLHFWRLTVHDDQTAVLTAQADSGEEPFYRQRIPFTDFPLEEVAIWAGWDETLNAWVLHLPSEH